MKKVLITGCSSGVGRMLVRPFLENGWSVVATMRRAAERQDLFKQELSDYPKSLVIKNLDVISQEDRSMMASYIQEGGIDCLVNNAGFALFGALEDYSEAQIRNQLEVNLTAPILLTRAFLPALRLKKGRVINVSSMMAFTSFPLSSVYCASKSGLSIWSEAMRHELAELGVSVHVVEPGGFRTNFGSNIEWGTGDVSDYRTWTQGYHRLHDQLSEGTGKAPAPVVNRILSIAKGESRALRYRAGLDAFMTALMNWLIPENIRLFVMGRLFKKVFTRS
ncbi:MAG: SDR family NAD(P)-dependent oxidoreductase [Deltaproteobacteria bacterium]|jgi:short-subunit dehydrogenase|nr:SDR family NAD(P)-dependent oxidoreductase [Deltaproteobacteria bacterium]MBT6433727.1 SDR family NAD(P)-dependent oxidoreductase [Deltaproteobacteria bacterium]MBT6490758.1 SDR family NAD(P)-dependent oxidoreductase [Deltaproteobacteria bacterium]